MHVLRKFQVNRRRMLRGLVGGAVVTVGLPPLEAMLNRHGEALAGGAPLPKRFISFMFGNGVMLSQWEPAVVGPDWVPSPQLETLTDIKSSLTVCTGLRNRFGGNAITHHEGMCVFSGYDFVPRNDLPGFASDWGGPTIDQVIADAIEQETDLPIRSLQVGVSKYDSPADNGSTAKALSARGVPGALTALPPERNPKFVWNSLFGETGTPNDDSELRVSVLDAVKDDVSALRRQLGTLDNQRLDAHLQNVSELQDKIIAGAPSCDIPNQPTLENLEPNGQEQLIAVNQLMSELIAHAFVCDQTRVASNLFLSVAGESIFGEISNPSTQHVHSHAYNQGYHNGIVFMMDRFGDLVRTLRDTQDIDGTSLLDSTLLFCSSEISTGNHSWQRQPILIAGHGRGYLQSPGIHYRAVAQNSPSDDQTSAGNTSDVLLTLLQWFDPGATEIGGGAPRSETPLTAILA